MNELSLDTVVSLFDGKSCGQIALNRSNIGFGQYFASEIDKSAIKVTQHNFSNTTQLGDVTKVNGDILPKVDLLMGGSPCQGFSFSGKQLAFDDPRSKLFFEFVRIRDETNPRYWFLENVMMKQEYQDIITEYLGVEPVEINSNLVSAQNRARLYWSNFDIDQPLDKKIDLIDILEDKSMVIPAAIRGRRLDGDDMPTTQCLEVGEGILNKANCLTTVAKDSVLTTLGPGRHPNAFDDKLPYRHYTAMERCRLQTVPEDYFGDVVNETQQRIMIGNGWTIDVIVHILLCIEKHMKGIKVKSDRYYNRALW